MSLQAKYKLTKELAVNLSSLPLEFLSRLSYRRRQVGLRIASAGIISYNITGRLWFRVLEMMRKET